MRRIYEDMAYGPAPVEGNFWATTIDAPRWPALQGDESADFAIIGGGYTGLSAALHLARAGADVALLEAEHPGWGASGRNGGFCCLGGSALDDSALIRRYGSAEAGVFFNAMRSAIDHVAETLDSCAIDADTHSQGEVVMAHRPRDVQTLQNERSALKAHHGIDATWIPGEALADHGMSSPAFHGGLHVPLGFALNPLKYATGLAREAAARGARIHGGTPVTAITSEGGLHRLETPKGTLRAKTLIVATNGYSSEDVPAALNGRYLPLQSNILVTRPLTDEEIAAQGWSTDQMCYDTRRLLHYFRLMPDRRFLFGSRGAVRTTPDSLAAFREIQRQDFEAMFPAWRHVETPHYWSGLVCLSRRLTPFAGPLPGMENAYAAMAYHGNGVAMASYCGKEIAKQALGQTTEGALPAFMHSPLRRFPLGRWRRALLHGAYRWYGWQDRG